MTTAKQIEANRRNAQQSTGPRTDEAKARSSQNALRHGLSSRKPVLPDENPEAYTRHQNQLAGELKPVGYIEGLLVDQITDLMWRLRRVPGMEAMIIRAELDDLETAKILTEGTRHHQLSLTYENDVISRFEAEQRKRAKRQTLALWVGQAVSRCLQTGAVDRLAAYETRKLRELEKLLAMLQERQDQRLQDRGAKPTIIDVEVEERRH